MMIMLRFTWSHISDYLHFSCLFLDFCSEITTKCNLSKIENDYNNIKDNSNGNDINIANITLQFQEQLDNLEAKMMQLVQNRTDFLHQSISFFFLVWVTFATAQIIMREQIVRWRKIKILNSN